MKRQRQRRRHYNRNGRLTGFCTLRQFAELKETAERMKQQRIGQRPPARFDSQPADETSTRATVRRLE